MKELAFQNIWICIKYTMWSFLTSRKDTTIDTDQPQKNDSGRHIPLFCSLLLSKWWFKIRQVYVYMYMCMFLLELYFVFLCVRSLRQSLPSCLTAELLHLGSKLYNSYNIFAFDSSSTGLPSSIKVIPEYRTVGGDSESKDVMNQ